MESLFETMAPGALDSAKDSWQQRLNAESKDISKAGLNTEEFEDIRIQSWREYLDWLIHELVEDKAPELKLERLVASRYKFDVGTFASWFKVGTVLPAGSRQPRTPEVPPGGKGQRAASVTGAGPGVAKTTLRAEDRRMASSTSG